MDSELKLRASRASVRDRGGPGVTGAHAVAGAGGCHWDCFKQFA
jgi:hypothetical protein